MNSVRVYLGRCADFKERALIETGRRKEINSTGRMLTTSNFLSGGITRAMSVICPEDDGVPRDRRNDGADNFLNVAACQVARRRNRAMLAVEMASRLSSKVATATDGGGNCKHCTCKTTEAQLFSAMHRHRYFVTNGNGPPKNEN